MTVDIVSPQSRLEAAQEARRKAAEEEADLLLGWCAAVSLDQRMIVDASTVLVVLTRLIMFVALLSVKSSPLLFLLRALFEQPAHQCRSWLCTSGCCDKVEAGGGSTSLGQRERVGTMIGRVAPQLQRLPSQEPERCLVRKS